jgi:hypothetical protein
VSEYFDIAERIRSHDDIARAHRTLDLDEYERLPVAWMIATLIGTVAIYALFGWVGHGS